MNVIHSSEELENHISKDLMTQVLGDIAYPVVVYKTPDFVYFMWDSNELVYDREDMTLVWNL